MNRKWQVFLGVCLLTACARSAGERSPSLPPTPQPSSTASAPAQDPTLIPPATDLPAATPAAPAYPAPEGGATAAPAPVTEELPAPGSSPPYPGPNQPVAGTATALPPPYPGEGASPAPSATLAPTSLPDITPTGLQTKPPAAEPTRAPTSTPTRTPRVRPTVTAAVIEPVCAAAEGLTLCSDPFLGIDFTYPSIWGEILQGDLLPEAGALYTYEIQGSLRAEGRSGAFIPPLGSALTAFPGFYSDLLAERCRQFSPAQVCEEVQPQVILVLVFPGAGEICDPAPGDLSSPLAILALGLPDHPSINGFVFYSSFLSSVQNARLADYQAALLDPPVGRACTNYLRSQFNVRILEMVAGVRNDRLDAITTENVRKWLTLGESIQIGE